MTPPEWDVRPLGKFVSLQRGHDLPERYRRPGEVPVMGSAGPNGFHDTAIVRGPGVLLGRSGASFGQAHYSTCDYWPHNTALYVTDFHGNHPLFAFYFLKGIDFTRHNSGGAQQSLNRNFIAPILVAFPMRAEQEAIAEALSDADALIESLEQLLTKKRQIKKGTMQELLTAKKRLPGFSAEWEVKRVSELGEIVTGATPRAEWEVKRVSELGEIVTGATPRTDNATFWGDRYPWITPTDISVDRDMVTSDRMITQEGMNSIRMLPAGTVLVTCIASIGKNAILKTNGACNQQINAVIPDDSYSAEFLYYLFEFNTQYILANAGTTATSIVSKATFSGLAFEIPQPTEQTAIANILSDLDAEITALEAKLSKARQLKQGMMQELLTGRIRLR